MNALNDLKSSGSIALMALLLVACHSPKATSELSWSAPEAGLRSRIFFSGNPNLLSVQYEIQNVSSNEISVWHGNSLGRSLLVCAWDARGTLLALTEEGHRLRSEFNPAPEMRIKNFPIVLRPDDIDKLWPALNLSDLFILPRSGSVACQVIYSKSEGDPWNGELCSNVLKVSVTRTPSKVLEPSENHDLQ